MNIVLLKPQEISNDRTTISDERSKHIKKVLRAKNGDTVRVGVINGNMGTGVIEKINKKEITLKLSINAPPPTKKPIQLILALPRPIMLKRVLAQVTSLGVSQLHLINAKRVEKSFFNATLVKKQKFEPYIMNGLEQAIDTKPPKVELHHRFKSFIEDCLSAKPCNEKRLVAHPEEANTLSSLPALSLNHTTTLAIGPEGGWIDYEIDKFKEVGFSTFSLGPRILRVDTAVPAIISQISLLKELSPL